MVFFLNDEELKERSRRGGLRPVQVGRRWTPDEYPAELRCDRRTGLICDGVDRCRVVRQTVVD